MDEYFDVEHLVSKEPIGQFKKWFEEAATQTTEPNAFCLATATKSIENIEEFFISLTRKKLFQRWNSVESFSPDEKFRRKRLSILHQFEQSKRKRIGSNSKESVSSFSSHIFLSARKSDRGDVFLLVDDVTIGNRFRRENTENLIFVIRLGSH